MCGRFVSSSPPDELARYFGAAPPERAQGEAAVPGRAGAVPDRTAARPNQPAPFEPNYNVAPGSDVVAVYQDRGLRRLDSLRWGLVPYWAKDVSAGYKMINARAENVARSGAFRRPLARRRCIIPADGFYEWAKVAGHRRKQPYYVHRVDDEPLAFAGLWEIWRGRGTGGDEAGEEAGGAGGVWVRSCSIITTAANATMAPVHDRMPVILPPSVWETWLDPDNHDADALVRLLVPAPDGLLALHPVSIDVSNARNAGPHLIEEVDTVDPDGRTSHSAGRTARAAAAASGQGSLLDLDR